MVRDGVMYRGGVEEVTGLVKKGLSWQMERSRS